MKTVLSAAALVVCLSIPLSSQANEGYDKGLQAYSCVDYPKALSIFKVNAEKGHGLSQYMMGIMVEQGQGTQPNVDAAFNWYMTSAKQGIIDAYYALADMYAKGISVAKDPVRAYAWFELAQKGGHNLAGDMVRSLGKELQPEQIAMARQFGEEWQAKLSR